MGASAFAHAADLSFLAQDGAGLPIVLLHGIGSEARSFAPLMAALDGAPVLAWNAPGYGKSASFAVPRTTADEYATALDRLLATRAEPRVLLVGHSLGTLVAARYALHHPTRVAGLVLMSPALGYKALADGDLPESVAPRLRELAALGAPAFAAKRAANLVGDPAARPDIVASVEASMGRVTRPGYDQACWLLATGDLLHDAAHLAVKTRVIVGSADRVTPPANAEKLFAALPARRRDELVIVPGAGHAIAQEEPDAVAAAIRAFVQGLDDV